MAEGQGAVRSFLGRLPGMAINRLSPGSAYDSRGNYLHNGGRAAAATVAKIAANTFIPGAGAVVDKILSGWVNRGANYGIGDVSREGIPIYGAPQSRGGAASAAPPTANLGLGAQSPGGDWRGYLQGAGSVNNFGNQSFMRPGSFTNWSPTSGWGQQLMAQQPTDGSLAGFGNNVGGFLSGGARSGGGGVRSPVASSGSRAGLTRSGGSAAGWVTAINQGEILGQFQGDPERYTRAS